MIEFEKYFGAILDGKIVACDKMKRISGANMTAAFLSSLPKKWTKQKLELDATAINNLGVSDADLAEHDLVRPGKAVWSRKEEGANDE